MKTRSDLLTNTFYLCHGERPNWEQPVCVKEQVLLCLLLRLDPTFLYALRYCCRGVFLFPGGCLRSGCSYDMQIKNSLNAAIIGLSCFSSRFHWNRRCCTPFTAICTQRKRCQQVQANSKVKMQYQLEKQGVD